MGSITPSWRRLLLWRFNTKEVFLIWCPTSKKGISHFLCLTSHLSLKPWKVSLRHTPLWYQWKSLKSTNRTEIGWPSIVEICPILSCTNPNKWKKSWKSKEMWPTISISTSPISMPTTLKELSYMLNTMSLNRKRGPLRRDLIGWVNSLELCLLSWQLITASQKQRRQTMSMMIYQRKNLL